MNEKNIGSCIYQSVRTVEDTAREIDSLLKIMKQMLQETISKLCEMKVTEQWKMDDRHDDSGWVFTDQADYIGIGKKRGKTTKKYLNIQISLVGDGMRTEEDKNECPLLHVSLWDEAICFADDYYVSISEMSDEPVELQHEVLFNWFPSAKNWEGQVWTFSVELTSINKMEDIKTKIVNPFSALIRGLGVEGADLKNIEGIVLYEKAYTGTYRLKSKGNND